MAIRWKPWITLSQYVAGILLAVMAWLHLLDVAGIEPDGSIFLFIGAEPEGGTSFDPEALFNGIFLLLAVGYLHWVMRWFLMPLSQLSADRRAELKRRVRLAYSQGMFAKAIAFGYFVLCAQVFALSQGFAIQPWYGLGFIVLGTLVQTRALVLACTKPDVARPMAAAERSSAAGNASSPDPVGGN